MALIGRLLVAALLTTPMAGEAMAESDAFRWCRSSVPLSGHAPILELRGAESYGSDRSAERFVLAVMQGAAAWAGLRDREAARAVVQELRAWAAAGALEHLVEVGPDASNTNSVYSLRRALIGILAAWRDLASVAEPSERAVIEAWLARLVANQDTNTGARRERRAGAAVSNRNNHAYLRASVDALWAAWTGDAPRAARAADLVRRAVEEMRSDGSLPLETNRGGRALWYQRHAVASLVYLGELLAPLGYDVWAARADGHSLHTAVAFLNAALRDPSLVADYASANRSPQPGSSSAFQDLGFLRPRGHGRHYMAWVESYRAQFPQHPNLRQLDDMVQPTLAAARPLVDEFVGGNATCRILVGRMRPR